MTYTVRGAKGKIVYVTNSVERVKRFVDGRVGMLVERGKGKFISRGHLDKLVERDRILSNI